MIEIVHGDALSKLGEMASDCTMGGDPVPAVVLDPFAGSGTTLLVAHRLGRAAVGIDLNPEYVILAKERLLKEKLLTEAAG